MLRLDAKWGRNLEFFIPHICQEALSGNRHSSASFETEATRHVEKFRECRLTDVRESELTDKKKKLHKT